MPPEPSLGTGAHEALDLTRPHRGAGRRGDTQGPGTAAAVVPTPPPTEPTVPATPQSCALGPKAFGSEVAFPVDLEPEPGLHPLFQQHVAGEQVQADVQAPEMLSRVQTSLKC